MLCPSSALLLESFLMLSMSSEPTRGVGARAANRHPLRQPAMSVLL